MNKRRLSPVVVVLGALLSGCGSEAEMGTPPIAQLAGAWLMPSRAPDCSYTLATFGSAGFYKLFNDNRPRKKYFDIKQFAVGVGFVVLDVENLAVEPEMQLKMKLEVATSTLKLVDLTTMDGLSFKSPPATLRPEEADRMKKVFAIAETHYTMVRCPATPAA